MTAPHDDELEPVADQEAARLRSLELELADEAEDLLHLAAEVDHVFFARRSSSPKLPR
jgi:hypothetical protein